MNDNKFKFWTQQQVNCWPTVMVFGPDSKPLYRQMGESCEENVSAILSESLKICVDQIESEKTKSDKDWVTYLSTHQLPLKLEKDKEAVHSKKKMTLETILALR